MNKLEPFIRTIQNTPNSHVSTHYVICPQCHKPTASVKTGLVWGTFKQWLYCSNCGYTKSMYLPENKFSEITGSLKQTLEPRWYQRMVFGRHVA